MRILRVVASVDPATGGPPSGLRAITPALTQLGHTTEFLTLDDPAAAHLQSWVGTVHAFGPVRNRYAFSPKLLPWLETNLPRFDAVVVHGLWQYLGRAVRVASKNISRAPPYFVFPHGMLDPSLRRTYPFRHVKKWLYWWLYERQVLRDARAVLFTCEEERRLARQTFPGYACEERVVAYGAASPDRNHAVCAAAWRARCPAVDNRRYWLFLGRIHSKKGIELLFDAYAGLLRDTPSDVRRELPDLVIAGPCFDQGYLAALQKNAESNGIAARVHWTGMLNGPAKWGALREAEAFVLPSHQENFGIAVVEALACGTPVLISDRVNIWRELSEDNAALVEPADAGGTLRLMQRWLALDPAAREAMSTAAEQCFQKRFEISHAAENLAAQLRELIAPSPPARH